MKRASYGLAGSVLMLAMLLFAGASSASSGSQDRRDANCTDFPTQAAAQAYFIAHGGPASDPDGLDADGDGVACESNPCPCSTSTGGGGGGDPEPAPPPPDPTVKKKLCGNFVGVSKSRVCLKAILKGEQLKKVKSFRFRGLPASCGDGAKLNLAGKDKKIGGDGKRFSSHHPKVLGPARGVRGEISGKVSGGGKKARGIVSVNFKNQSGAACHSGNCRWKVS